MTDGPPDLSGAPAPPARKWARVRTKPVLIGIAALAVCAAVGAYFAVQTVRANRALARAHAALDRRAFAEASAHAETYRAHRPTGAATYLLLARVARRSGDEAGADAHLREYENRYPQDPELGRERWFLRAQQGDPSAVNAVTSAALASADAADPLALEAALIGGTKLLRSQFATTGAQLHGPGADLLARLLRCARLWLGTRTGTADQVEGLVWRGLLLVFANDLAGIDDFRAAIALDPDHIAARLQLASAIIQSAPQEALAHLEHARRHAPTDPVVARALARVYLDLGRPTDARPLFAEVLAARANDADALTDSAQVAVDTGQYAEAERLLTRAIALAPEYPRPLVVLALCLRAAGRADEAKAQQDKFERLIERLQTRAAPPPR
ncbi:MAG: tetratricopeptide repeat protein [Planctomycetes bacterium]|nr:tetratricopeptide repeat protein [Planctomycetota bacterium]